MPKISVNQSADTKSATMIGHFHKLNIECYHLNRAELCENLKRRI